MAGYKRKFATDGSETVWLKRKEIRTKSGDTGEVFQSSFDTGGGKMIKISVYADLSPTTFDDGKEALAVRVSKWKGNGNNNQRKKQSW